MIEAGEKAIISQLISDHLGLKRNAVQNTISLLEEGSTIPFIARYRKERTGSLDETQLFNIEQDFTRFKELSKRKAYILKSIASDGKLTESLKQQIQQSWDAARIEDLYLPFKKKRKTRATKARENGLQGLADIIMDQRIRFLDREAKAFINKNVPDTKSALIGARDIIAEEINENPKCRDIIRKLFERHASLQAKVIPKKKAEAIKYKDYFDYSEKLKRAPAHRILAVFRAEKEGFIKSKIQVDESISIEQLSRYILKPNADYESEDQIKLAVADAYKRLLSPSIETEFKNHAKTRADQEAISVFSENLKQLLMAAPLGNKLVMGIDPGFRTGCKVVCLDRQGNLIHHTTIFPHPPQKQTNASIDVIKNLAKKYDIEAIAIGNGTAGRETQELIKSIGLDTLESFLVNEDGASIYSASEIAREEFPKLDLTYRGAVSIARRLIDPLSELVKIDPKSIGVGQYQHDVNQSKLKENLNASVSYCVNAVGVNLNTASKHLLSHIAGLGPTLANNIVSFRSENGPFSQINTILKVPRMGAKAFEQCGGFLRIRNGENPLDNTGVHPERYKLVKQIAKDKGIKVEALISNNDILAQIDLNKYISDEIGLPTLKDIVLALKKPGHDIRGKAEVFEFSEGISKIEDIEIGMRLNGIITNITKFGAFVDLGIKEAGLIHVSQISDQYISDPLQVVKINQKVNAKVIDIDLDRKRISLSLKGTH